MVTAALLLFSVLSTEPNDPGRTLSYEEAKRFTLPVQPVKNDTGINVLLDHAHQASFQMMWDWPYWVRDLGFRVVGSHAAVDSVLDPKGKSRIRVPDGKRRPFAWWPNPKFNVVVTYQHGASDQDYLPEEIEAIDRFVQDGGGLVLVGTHPAENRPYSLKTLLAKYSVAFSSSRSNLEGKPVCAFQVPEGWTALAKGTDGQTVAAVGKVGKGRVAVLDSALATFDDKAAADNAFSRNTRSAFVSDLLKKVAEGRKPVAGTLRLPLGDGGVGGPIYPEMEERVEGAVVYYAKNQTDAVLNCVRKDVPRVDRMVRHWSPSPKPIDPMFLILAAGGGGGWAVNIYEPKEVGIISPDPDGILSILAHEVAHTCYSGPSNAKGQSAGRLPGVFSEAHAGWFQRRSDFWRNGKTGHDANRLFTFDPDGTQVDLSKGESYPYGQAWTKLWWLWQKLDEEFGTTWYPRWMWVKNTRWADQPNRELSWDDVVEDMSIAVEADLFPMMRKLGTTLGKDRFPEAEFQGERLTLEPFLFDITPAGNPIVRKIADYTKPLQ